MLETFWSLAKALLHFVNLVTFKTSSYASRTTFASNFCQQKISRKNEKNLSSSFQSSSKRVVEKDAFNLVIFLLINLDASKNEFHVIDKSKKIIK